MVIENLKKFKILVVGDLMLDIFIYGEARKISPEAPVPVVSVRENTYLPGGAANVAYNLHELGISVELYGITGRDQEGEKLLSSLKKNNIKTSGIITLNSRPTTTKTRILSGNQQIVRCDREVTVPIEKKTVDILMAMIEKSIARKVPDAVIISDYNKGTVSKKLISSILILKGNSRCVIFADPKGSDSLRYKGVDVITPNNVELKDLTGLDVSDSRKINRAVNLLMDRCKLSAIVVTRGKDGISYKLKRGKLTSISSQAKDVYDVTGAGDTVISTLAVAYIITGDLGKSVKAANLAAGIVINRIGTSSISQSEFSEILNSDNKNPSKIINLPQLKSEILRHRQNNKKIIFTNGCFDVLHPGHIKLLKKAKSLGGILVVGLNSDRSVRRLKGRLRPIINESQRSGIISLLGFVDYVTIFNQDTPIQLIEELVPDILVKGGDYKPEDVVGSELVESHGGKVVIVPLYKDYSTSAIFKGIRRT